MHQQDVRSVGVWIRVSTEDQAKGDSPATHKARAEQYAQFKGWSVAEVYDLSGVSGKAVMDHPEAKRMLDDVRTGRISALVFSKLARLARSTKGLLEVSEFFREHNADLISLQESIDTTTPSGRLFYTMIAGLAEWEREEIVDRVKAAVVTRAKMGRKVAGAAPYGYHWVGDEFLPHPDEAPVRALAYELFAEYQRKGTVARILNERGFRTRRGNKFSIQSIQLLLVDPAAKGLRRCNYTTADQRGGKVSIKPEDEWEWHPCEAIVAPELWERCNAILKKQREGRSPGPRGNYLFSGKVKCEADGETMYVLNESPKFVCRKCRRKIPQDDLEAIFCDRLRAFFASPEELADFLKTTLDEVNAKEAQIQALEKERSQLGRDREKLLRGYLDEEVEATRFTPLDKEMGERIDELALGIAAIEGEVAALRVTSDSSEEIISGARTLYDRWDELTFEQKRSVIEAITDQIVIGGRDIAIHLHYVPSQQDDGNYMKNTLGCCIFFPNRPLSLWGRNTEYADIAVGSVGEQLFQRRRELGVTKRQLAHRLGVHHEMIGLWERGEHEPRIKHLPKVIELLESDGWLPNTSFGERLYRFRAIRGWTQNEFGKWIGVDGRTIGRWEAGKSVPNHRQRDLEKRMRFASGQLLF